MPPVFPDAASHQPPPKTPPLFTRLAKGTALAAGRPVTFLIAVFIIVVWGVTGPLFHYSDTWQLVINTGTTIVTFLMVFLIQATQNRDSAAIHLKLDELIRSIEGARNALIDLDCLTDEELKRMQQHYENLAHKPTEELRELKEDPATVEQVIRKQ